MKLFCVIDYQNDFVTGSLGFEDAPHLEEGIAALVEKFLRRGDAVLFTRDTHEEDYLQTREGVFLPIPHCIAGTEGHALYGRLHAYEEGPKDRVAVVDKPTFGCPTLPQDAVKLCGGVPEAVELCGLVTNICVISNAVLLQTAFPNMPVSVHAGLCAAVGTGHLEALTSLRSLGVQIL